MKRISFFPLLITSILFLLISPVEIFPVHADEAADEFIVYSVIPGLDMGYPDQEPTRDFYVNMGSRNGLQMGSVLDVLRRTPTYNLSTQKLYKDLTFPFARIKVIHLESNAAICRLEKMLPRDTTPTLQQAGVIVGDLVRKFK